MNDVIFLDANIIMYAIGKEHPFRNPCRKILEQIKNGTIEVVSCTEVIQEILYRYFSLKMPEIAKEASLAVKTICSQIYPVTIEETDLALELLLNNPSIGTRDAIHAATMMNHGINRILSTDSHFDSIAGIERVQPV
jgi:hypothetical protein